MKNHQTSFWQSLILIMVCLFGFTIKSSAQTEPETKVFNGTTYYNISGSYYLLDDIGQELIPISSSKITLKYNSGVTRSQIESFETTHNLVYQRKAMTGWYDYHLNSSADLFEHCNAIQNSSLVELVEVCGPIKFQINPNDVLSYNASTQTWVNWGISATQLNHAWNKTTGDPSIVAAFIDTGVDWWHEDFAQATGTSGAFWFNPGEDAWSDPNDPSTGDGIDNDTNGFVDDWRGWNFYQDTNDVSDDIGVGNKHGTSVTGVAVGRSNNFIGVSGVAGGWGGNDGIKAMVLKVGEFGGDTIFMADILDDNILYAAKNGAHIISMSVTLSTNKQSVSDAIKLAYNLYGCVILGGTGNMDIGQPKPVKFPASHPLVIAIGASNMQDRLYKAHAGLAIDLVAPGDTFPVMKGNNGYAFSLGTSIATPFAAGIAGLMLSINPCLNNEEVGNILKRRADQVHAGDLGYRYFEELKNPGHAMRAGYGRVNAKRAVNTAEAMKENTLDLYIKDHYSDFGFPQSYPDTTFYDDWSDIWVRNQPDGQVNREMEEIEYTTAHPAYVYVRVRNKSCVASNGSDVLNVYWTNSCTGGSWPANWDGTDTTVGNSIGSVSIPALPAGADTIFEFAWEVLHEDTTNWGVCIMGRIVSAADPISADPNLSVEIRSNNNIAIRNLKVMDIFPGRVRPYFGGQEYPYGIKILSGTFADGVDLPVELRFDVPYGLSGSNLAEEAELKLFLSEELWQIFLNTTPSDWEGIAVVGEKELLITSPHARIRNLEFGTNQRHWFFFGFNFLTEEVSETYSYRYHISEVIDEQVQGAMNFTINRQPREDFEADAGPDQFIYQGQTAQVSAADISEAATYNWYDSNDSLIYSGKNPSLSPTVSEKYKLEVIADADLYKDYDDIEIKVNPYAITSLTPNPASTNLVIAYDADEANSAYLILQPVIGGGSSNYIISTSQNQTTLNVGAYPPGIYAVLLVCDGVVVDSEMLTIQ